MPHDGFPELLYLEKCINAKYSQKNLPLYLIANGEPVFM